MLSKNHTNQKKLKSFFTIKQKYSNNTYKQTFKTLNMSSIQIAPAYIKAMEQMQKEFAISCVTKVAEANGLDVNEALIVVGLLTQGELEKKAEPVAKQTTTKEKKTKLQAEVAELINDIGSDETVPDKIGDLTKLLKTLKAQKKANEKHAKEQEKQQREEAKLAKEIEKLQEKQKALKLKSPEASQEASPEASQESSQENE